MTVDNDLIMTYTIVVIKSVFYTLITTGKIKRGSKAMTKGLDKIIVVIAYKNDATKEVGEDTLILNVWDGFRNVGDFHDNLEKVVDAMRIMKNFTVAKICAVLFTHTASVQEEIKSIQKDFAKMDGDRPFTFEDWDFRFFPNGKYIGPYDK